MPFVRTAEPVTRPKPKVMPEGATRSFGPASEWLYVKLYTGPATADGVLRDVLAPVVAEAGLPPGSWFFIRYGDPDWHVRLRFHGDPEMLHGPLLAKLRLRGVGGGIRFVWFRRHACGPRRRGRCDWSSHG